VLDELERAGLRVDSLQIDEGESERVVVAEFKTPDRTEGAQLVDRLRDVEGVRRVEWTA
jgi:hypothetical protein